MDFTNFKHWSPLEINRYSNNIWDVMGKNDIKDEC